jgi:hypothetical protein
MTDSMPSLRTVIATTVNIAYPCELPSSITGCPGSSDPAFDSGWVGGGSQRAKGWRRVDVRDVQQEEQALRAGACGWVDG